MLPGPVPHGTRGKTPPQLSSSRSCRSPCLTPAPAGIIRRFFPPQFLTILCLRVN